MSEIGDFNRGLMRGGTVLEDPMAGPAEQAGAAFARGNGAQTGGGAPGGGFLVLAVPVALLIVSIGLPALFLAFFATPFLMAMQRAGGDRLRFTPSFIALAKALFAFVLVAAILVFAIGQIAIAMPGHPFLQALMWSVMDLGTWWTGVDPRQPSAFNFNAPAPVAPSLGLRIAAMALFAGLPFVAMAITLPRVTTADGPRTHGGFLSVLLRCIGSVTAGVLLAYLSFALLGALGEALPTKLERYLFWMTLLFGATALAGGVLIWLGGQLVTGGRMSGLFFHLILGLIIWGGFCAVAFYHFRAADAFIAPIMGFTDAGNPQAALIAYCLLQLPGLFFATQIAAEQLRTLTGKLFLAAALALVGNGIMLTLLSLWMH